MKIWTEAQAWRYLVERWNSAATRESDGMATILRSLAVGICESMRILRWKKKISAPTYERMCRRKLEHSPVHEANDYWWPLTRAGARSRAAFCRKMAKLAEKED